MAYTRLNPQTIEKDFFGFPGSIFISSVLPVTVLFLYLCCNEKYVVQGINIDFNKLRELFYSEITENWLHVFLNAACWKAYLCWFFGLVVLDLVIPGKIMQGIELRDGTKLDYLINGKELSILLVSVLSARGYYYGFNLPELTFLYDNFLPLMMTVFEFSVILSCFVYICSFIPLRTSNGLGNRERILATGGNSGNFFFDWFIGRELNPRIGSWDIKLFCELRPGLLLWFLFNLSCLQRQYQSLGYITNSLLLVNSLQAFYVFDGVLNEEGCLTMIDITTDGFGFMLAYGDLSWLPFSYCLQSRYLSLNDYELQWPAVFAIIGVMTVGYWIFSASNNQKSQFRQGKLPHLKSIQTDRGTKLLIEGWWGKSQHINYFGDMLIALSWCLPTGFNTPLTYFYIIYFTCLLLHRQTRDEEKCQKKYGEHWAQYTKLVPYKIIPYIY